MQPYARSPQKLRVKPSIPSISTRIPPQNKLRSVKRSVFQTIPREFASNTLTNRVIKKTCLGQSVPRRVSEFSTQYSQSPPEGLAPVSSPSRRLKASLRLISSSRSPCGCRPLGGPSRRTKSHATRDCQRSHRLEAPSRRTKSHAMRDCQRKTRWSYPFECSSTSASFDSERVRALRRR
jgi:hypothetical protein